MAEPHSSSLTTSLLVQELRETWPYLGPKPRHLILALVEQFADTDAALIAAVSDLESAQQEPGTTARSLWQEATAQGPLSEPVTSSINALATLMDQWNAEDAAGDPAAQEAEWETLKAALDADRLSSRPLFP